MICTSPPFGFITVLVNAVSSINEDISVEGKPLRTGLSQAGYSCRIDVDAGNWFMMVI